MSPQMGRPKSENPRKKQLGVRFDDEELRKLDEVAEHYNFIRKLKNRDSRVLWSVT